jgi:hypothetical protein
VLKSSISHIGGLLGRVCMESYTVTRSKIFLNRHGAAIEPHRTAVQCTPPPPKTSNFFSNLFNSTPTPPN